MEELGAFPRVFFFCLVGFFLYSLLNAQMCLGCKEQKQIQEKGAVSWTIGVHWTFAFVSQLAVSWCRLLHIYSILPRLRMQSTRGYSFFFLAITYNIHLVAGWDPDWMRFTPKTNHSGVHLETQRDQLLQRSCDHCVDTPAQANRTKSEN